MSQYGKVEYWEDRYTKDPEPFDWYQRFQHLQQIFESNFTQESKILNIGAGNSRLSEEMLDEGYSDITNIDNSQVVIKYMQEKYSGKMEYKQMNLKQLEFENESFDVVIDKATLDCILCGENSIQNAQKVLEQIHRILKNNGVYIIISYADPQNRLEHLQKDAFGWQITHQAIAKPNISGSTQEVDKDNQTQHYVYICKKQTKTENNIEQQEEQPMQE